MRHFLGVVLVISLFALGGCYKKLNFVKSDMITSEKLSKLKKGKTLKEEVLRIFGQPESDLKLGDKETFFYKSPNLKALWIEFDEEGKIADFYHNRS